MAEISLKKVRKEGKGLVAPEELPKEFYPTFDIREDVPLALMGLPIGMTLTAKVKIAEKENREGKNARKSMGFDILSITVGGEKKKEEENV